MNQKTLVALGLFLLLGALVVWLLRSPERGERVGEKVRPIAAFSKDTLAKVTITAKGKRITLARVGGTWRISAPVKYAADKYATDTLEKKLLELTFGDLISELEKRHAEFEVDKKNGVRVQVTDNKGKSLGDFYLGKVIDGFTMLRLDGKKKVWQAAGALHSVFDKELRHWRDRRIVYVQRNSVRTLELATPAGSVRLSRKDGKAPWKVEASPIELDKLDTSAISNALSTLQSFAANDFADDKTAKTAGLETPTATISATLDNKKTVQIKIGAKLKDAYYVQQTGKPQIFTVKKWSIKSLLLRPIDLKDKAMLTFDAKKVRALTLAKQVGGKTESVDLVRKGKDWLGNGKKVASTTKLKKALEALSKLKAASFAKLPAVALGLDKPEWTVGITLEDGKKHELRIGAKTKESAKAVRVVGNPDVFMVRKYALDQFLLDPKNYK